jgi:ABC-type Fe3+-hydroxamate transport system substrate-binding protein
MPFTPKTGRSRVLTAAIAAAAMLGSATQALPWSRSYDHVYADSFGNLVILSPSGYKRIVVGQGHLAEDLAHYERTGETEVLYLTRKDGARRTVVRDCYRPPYLWKGRSYMYGLSEGVLPQAPCAGR